MAKSPLTLSNSILYEKPTFDDNFYKESFKDGYQVNGNEARLGKGRLDYLIDEYGVWEPDSDYSQAYLGYIDPREFIKATITGNDSITKRELDNPDDLDIQRINNERQTPFLQVNFDDNSIVGHEGRHRLSSFAKAGVTKLPIVFRDMSPTFRRYNTQGKQYNGILKGQDFGFGRGQDINLVSDLIPINYKNANVLREKFGYNK